MFQFPRFALVRKRVTGIAPSRVAPFGHPGIIACVPLPLAYRSLPRPSSPPCAQASSTCLRSLDYKSVGKQSTRDLATSDNPFEIESLSSKNSQIRDLPLLPLSNSIDTRARKRAGVKH